MKRHGHNAPLRKAKGKDADTSQCQRGLVVSTHGRHVIVEDEQGGRLICHPRGKKVKPSWATACCGNPRWRAAAKV